MKSMSTLLDATTQSQASSKKQAKRINKSTDNPFQSNNKAEITKRVNVGLAGQTPKKIIPTQNPSYHGKGLDTVTEQQDSTEEDQSPLPASESHHNILSAQEFLSRQSIRPKTGRGKHNPSPDEFFDYVVPSPSHDRLAANRLVINHRSKKAILLADDDKVAEENENDSTSLAVETERHDILNNYLLGLNLEGIQRGKQVALLGCWLFGSALKI